MNIPEQYEVKYICPQENPAGTEDLLNRFAKNGWILKCFDGEFFWLQRKMYNGRY